MLGNFKVTRWVMTLAVLVGAVWLLVTEISSPETPPHVAPPPPVFVAAAGLPTAPTTASWASALGNPEIQALWRDRRRQLDGLSRAYLQTSDADLAEVLRCSMQHLIDRSVRDVYGLRLSQARREGRDDLVRRLEHDLAELPVLNAQPGPGSPPGGEQP